jgi:hypothetical protein
MIIIKEILLSFLVAFGAVAASDLIVKVWQLFW